MLRYPRMIMAFVRMKFATLSDEGYGMQQMKNEVSNFLDKFPHFFFFRCCEILIFFRLIWLNCFFGFSLSARFFVVFHTQKKTLTNLSASLRIQLFHHWLGSRDWIPTSIPFLAVPYQELHLPYWRIPRYRDMTKRFMWRYHRPNSVALTIARQVCERQGRSCGHWMAVDVSPVGNSERATVKDGCIGGDKLEDSGRDRDGPAGFSCSSDTHFMATEIQRYCWE